MPPLVSFSYPEPFLRAVRRGALAKSISELASDWLVLTQDIVFLPCFHGIRLWIWPEPLVAPRVRRALGTRMHQPRTQGFCAYCSQKPWDNPNRNTIEHWCPRKRK